MVNLYAVVAVVATAAAQTSAEVILLTSSNFDQVIVGGDWLVKFSSPFCSSCKDFAPTYDRVATELHGELNVARVDMSTDAQLGERFDVRMLPSVRLFRDGKVYNYAEDSGSVDEVVWFAREGYVSSEWFKVSTSSDTNGQQAEEL